MYENKQRISELGFLSAFLCVFVIFIHISSNGIINLDKFSFVYKVLFFLWRACQFVVQGFIFLSAVKICMKYKEKNLTFLEYYYFIRNRVSVIFIPYVLWVFVYYVVFFSLSYFDFNFFDFIRYVFVGDLSAQFYFIVIIMQFYILFPLWLKYSKKIKPYIGIIIAFFITFLFNYYLYNFLIYISSGKFKFLYNDRIFTSYFLYFLIGCYVGLNYEKFKNFVIKNIKYITAIFLIFLIINTKISYEQFLNIRKYWMNDIIHMIYCCFAIMFWFYICIKLEKVNNSFTSLLNMINAGAYYTYLSHCLIMVLLNRFLNKFGIYSIRDTFIINFIVIYVFSISTSYGYVRFKNKLKIAKKEKEKSVV